MTLRISVYCSSSDSIDKKYIDLAFELGEAIGSRSWNLAWGGGQVSMMGAVARGVRNSGGQTFGVIPEVLADSEFADTASQELLIVGSMRERKGKIEELGDAFIALPGGLGTLEELFEIWVGRFLNVHHKPIVILDPFGVYDPLKELVAHLEEEGFIKPGQADLIHWCTTIDEALEICCGR